MSSKICSGTYSIENATNNKDSYSSLHSFVCRYLDINLLAGIWISQFIGRYLDRLHRLAANSLLNKMFIYSFEFIWLSSVSVINVNLKHICVHLSVVVLKGQLEQQRHYISTKLSWSTSAWSLIVHFLWLPWKLIGVDMSKVKKNSFGLRIKRKWHLHLKERMQTIVELGERIWCNQRRNQL